MKKILNFVVVALLTFTFFSCGEEEIDKTLPSPTIKFAFDTLYVDLNKIDNPPVVAFIKSEIGLETVNLNIEIGDSVVTLNSTNKFFDDKAYSLSQKILYASNHKTVIIEAIDKAGKKSEEKLPLKITNVIFPPKIEFSVDSIVYDELVGGDIPLTSYTISSDAGLTKVEMLLATADGQVSYIPAIELNDAPKTFEFSQLVEYTPIIKGFIVKATDTYNQVGIVTLPFIYKELPMPEITLLSADTISQAAGNVMISAKVKAVRGIKKIELVKKRNDGTSVSEEVIYSDNINGAVDEKTISYQVPLDDATSHIVIRTTNMIDKEKVVEIVTFVNMQFISSTMMGGVRYDIGLMRYYPTFITAAKLPEYEEYLGVYGLFSLKDKKTYSMDYYVAGVNNTANVDMKLNINWDVNNAWYQLSGIGAGTDDAAFKATNGTTIASLASKVAVDTRFKLMESSFSFESATAAALKKIDPSTVNATSVRFYDSGTVIAFKTGDASTAGGGRIGIMKEIKRIPISVQGYGTYQHQFAISVIQIKLLN